MIEWKRKTKNKIENVDGSFQIKCMIKNKQNDNRCDKYKRKKWKKNTKWKETNFWE